MITSSTTSSSSTFWQQAIAKALTDVISSDDHPKKMIICCDGGVDDILMLLHALRDPAVEIVGIIGSAGVTYLPSVIKNIQGCLILAGREDIPVVEGAAHPRDIPEEKLTTAVEYYGEDGKTGVTLATDEELEALPHPRHSSVEFLVSELASANEKDEQLYLINTGGLTDLATAFNVISLTNPDLCKAIKLVSIMGGAFAAENTNVSDFAEYNFYIDANSTHTFIEHCKLHDVTTLIIPTDTTHTVLMGEREAARIEEHPSPTAEVAAQLIRTIPEPYRVRFEERQPIHDELAFMALIHPECFRYKEANITINGDSSDEHKGEVSAGTPRGDTIAIISVAFGKADEIIDHYVSAIQSYARAVESCPT